MKIKQDKWWKRLWAPVVCYLAWLGAAFCLPSSPVIPIMVLAAFIGGGSLIYVFFVGEQMSYDNNADLTEYFTTIVEIEKLIESIPYPTTADVLNSASKWGVKKSLDELRMQCAIMRRTLQDIELERQRVEAACQEK